MVLANRIGVVSISDEETASIQRDICAYLEASLIAADRQADLNRFFEQVGIAFYGSEYELADNVKRARKLKLKGFSLHPITGAKVTSLFVGVGIDQNQLFTIKRADMIRFLVEATVDEINFRLASTKVRAISDTLKLLRTILLNLL